MSDILIRTEGRAGRITLNRPQALNALTEGMMHALHRALKGWAGDPAVALVLIDAAGDRAFCAGGDITAIYAAGRAGDLAGPRRFWRDEYRLNLAIARYPKPVVVLMQGFVMGGGVGVAGHASHRVAGESTRVAMPECGIGLVPDVGGSALLARAPGRLGAWLGCTGSRMGPGDAIHAGFADRFVPQDRWPALAAALCATGDAAAVADAALPPPASPLAARAGAIDALMAAPSLSAVWAGLAGAEGELAEETRAALARVSPLAAACAFEMQARLGPSPALPDALALEYRFVHRAIAGHDFLEGIRAAVIDKDRRPRWQHASPAAVDEAEVAAMLAPLGDEDWSEEEEP